MYNDKQDNNTLLNQKRCEKHDMVVVTQTTTTTGIDKPIKKIQWMQCKKCSYTVPLPEQSTLISKTT